MPSLQGPCLSSGKVMRTVGHLLLGALAQAQMPTGAEVQEQGAQAWTGRARSLTCVCQRPSACAACAWQVSEQPAQQQCCSARSSGLLKQGCRLHCIGAMLCGKREAGLASVAVNWQAPYAAAWPAIERTNPPCTVHVGGRADAAARILQAGSHGGSHFVRCAASQVGCMLRRTCTGQHGSNPIMHGMPCWLALTDH